MNINDLETSVTAKPATKIKSIRVSDDTYTVISNLAKIRAINGVLRELCFDYPKAKQAAKLIGEIERELEGRMDYS